MKRPNPNPARFAGVDLAWNEVKNGTGIAIGALADDTLVIDSVHEAVKGLDAILEILDEDITGIAIDAPLVVTNERGSRVCEQSLSAAYRPFHAGTHSSNLASKWDAGRRLAKQLAKRGYVHNDLRASRWQIECYPHPAMVEVFALDERIPYKQKRGRRVADQRNGQRALVRALHSLAGGDVMQLKLCGEAQHLLDESRIATLRGQCLKNNEDALDAIMCAYVAAWFGSNRRCHTFGDTQHGYIVVPNCGRLAE